MIRIFYGKPGAGKSFGAVRDLRDELLYSKRLIVTNLPIDLGRFNAYLQKEYPRVDFGDINHRIRFITEEQTKQFYCFRTIADDQLPCPDKEASMRGKHVNYDGTQAVSYYIDEAHIAFDARSWDKTGPELTYYASQHRHLNDQCVFITQHPDMLERRLRILAQQFWSHENLGIQKLWTFFQKPALMTCFVYTTLPSGTGKQPTEEKHVYKLNKPLADCYDTSAGIGIAGRKMPETKRKFGLPVWLLIFPVLLVIYLLSKAPRWTGDLMLSAVHKSKDIGAEDLAPGKPSAGRAPSPTGGPPGAASAAPSPAVVPGPVLVRSVVITAHDAIVVLTDGTVLTKGSGLLRITDDYVYATGGRQWQRQRGYVRPQSSAGGTLPQNFQIKVLTPTNHPPNVVVHENK